MPAGVTFQLSASRTTGQTFQESHACEGLSDGRKWGRDRRTRWPTGKRDAAHAEEEASLRLLEPLFARHLDRILETLALHLGSDPDLASLLSDDLAVARLKRSQQEYLLSLLNGKNGGIYRQRGRAGS